MRRKPAIPGTQSGDFRESVNALPSSPRRPGRYPSRIPNQGPQSPVPEFGEKNFLNLSGTPSQSLASGGASFLTVILAQVFEYSALSSNHFSRPGSVSGLIASTGHSGSQTPQAMHSSGWMTSIFSPS